MKWTGLDANRRCNVNDLEPKRVDEGQKEGRGKRVGRLPGRLLIGSVSQSVEKLSRGQPRVPSLLSVLCVA